MKRSIGFTLAVAMLAVTTVTESAQAQYYRRGNNTGQAVAAGVAGGVVGALLVGAITNSSNNARPVAQYEEVYEDDAPAPRAVQMDARQRARYDIYDLDVEAGATRRFGNGYFKVDAIGSRGGNESCRMVSEYEGRARIASTCSCYNQRSGKWINIDENDFVPAGGRRVVRRVVRREAPISVQINTRPNYGHGGPAVVAVPRGVYGPVQRHGGFYNNAPIAVPVGGYGTGAPAIAGPAYGVGPGIGAPRAVPAPLPAYGYGQQAPAVLPATPQAFR